MRIRRFNLSADGREEIKDGQVVTEIRIPFWKRVKMLFCSLMRVTVPVEMPPPPSPMDCVPFERTLIRVENRKPIKFVAETRIPFNSARYMSETEAVGFMKDSLAHQISTKLWDHVKLTKYNDPVQDAVILRAVVGVVDLNV